MIFLTNLFTDFFSVKRPVLIASKGLSILMLVVLQGCATQFGNASKQNIDPVGAYSGKAQVSSVLELSKTQQEIGVELPDGRVTSVRMGVGTQFTLGQKVKVTRQKDGTGSVIL